METMDNGDSETDVASLQKKFISAVKAENKDIVKSLLGEFFSTSLIFVKSWTTNYLHEKQENKFEIWRDAMYIAMETDTKQSEEIMKLLLDSDLIWSLDTKMHDLLLHRLIRLKEEVDDKDLRLIEMLLKSGQINVNARDEDVNTALHLTVDEKLISLLIQYGADVNVKDFQGKTPLMQMEDIRVSGIHTMLNEPRTLVDLDAVDSNGRTALMIAASDDRPDVVELLLKAGASVNLSDHLGFTALHHALYTSFDHYDHFPRNSEELKKRKEIFTILFDAKDERNDFCMRNKELVVKRIEIVEMLLGKQEIDVNALSFEKFSPLDIAEGSIPQFPSSIINTLKEKGAVLNVFGQTESQSKGEFHLDARCRLFLQQLVCEAATSRDGKEEKDRALVNKRLLTLIETFQDQILSGKDQQGRTALHLVAISFSIIEAVYYGRSVLSVPAHSIIYLRDLANTIAKKLITIGCSVNETDIYGRTPLHYADERLKKLLDESIDNDKSGTLDQMSQQSSKKSPETVKIAINQTDDKCFIRLVNNKQVEIQVQCFDCEDISYGDKQLWLKTVPRLLWENGEYAFRHPLVKQITEEVINLMNAIANEIKRLDPRFEAKPEFVGSSNEETKIDEPNEFDFCFVLTKISELCEVTLSPELPTGFVRLKRKPIKVDQKSDFDSFFGKDGILNTENLKWKFTTILRNALVNIENQQSLDWILEMPTRDIYDSIEKTSNFKIMKSLNYTSAEFTSIDIVPCIHVDDWWPDEAISNVSDEIKKFGCNLIFDRPQNIYPWVPYSESCARISFAKAESNMIKQSCDNAREASMIGKTIFEDSDSFACGYILKNCLLYCIEALTPTSEKASQLRLSLEELKSKFHQMDRYLWLNCLMKCHLEFVLQDFCPCYFLPNFSSPNGKAFFKAHSSDTMIDYDSFCRKGSLSMYPKLCKNAYLFYIWTSDDTPRFFYQSPAPDPLWERFDRNQLISSLCEIAYKDQRLSETMEKDSEITAALLIKKFMSAVEDENEDIVKSLLYEIFNTQNAYMKSWSSNSHSEIQGNRPTFEIWRDAMYIAMEKDTKHSEEIMKILMDYDIIWSLDTKTNGLLFLQLISNNQKVDDKTLRLIEMLLKSGQINVNATGVNGCTALYSTEEEQLISLLIRYGADANKMSGRWDMRVPTWQTILKEERSLMDLDAVDCRGRTALMFAASSARPDVVELLLNAGASVNLSDHLGFTALHHALHVRFDDYDHYFPRNSEELKKRKEIFTILFDEKDERSDFYKRNKEWIEKKKKIVEMLLGRQDIDVNALSFEKFSPLDIAEGCIPRTPSFIKNALKEKGAVLNVFRQMEIQSTSRFHLDVRCRLTLQRLFLNVWGHNPVEKILPLYLFQKGLPTLIEAFQDQIQSGTDEHGRTALHLIAISFSIIWTMYTCIYRNLMIDEMKCTTHLADKIVKELISIGCKVNETDVFGRTPLHYANFITRDSLISHGADESIKDKDGNSAIQQQSSTKFSKILAAVIDRKDEIYFLRLINNKQMDIEVQFVDSQVRAYDDSESWLKTVPNLLWEKGEYAFRHPLVEKITKEVTDLMSAIAKEIARLDPRFAIRPEFVGSSSDGTKLDKPNEFEFCFVLAKISELCEVSQSPELPSGFFRLKRKPTKVGEESDFDSFFDKDEILYTEKLNWQFTAILSNSLVNIESKQSLDWILELSDRKVTTAAIRKATSIKMIKPQNSTSVNSISIDIVPCIHIDGWWPDEAISNVSDETKKIGCNLIFDCVQDLYPSVPYSESCARISFAKAESDTIKQSCDNSREAYMIGKTMLKESRYTLKNCLLYCIEALAPTSEKVSQLGLSLEELESKFHQMDRYLWLKCLLKCHMEFVAQDYYPCYFLPNFISPIGKTNFKGPSHDWITDCASNFPELCKKAYALYRCTSSDTSEVCCQLPAPDPLWERFDRNQLIKSLSNIAYK